MRGNAAVIDDLSQCAISLGFVCVGVFVDWACVRTTWIDRFQPQPNADSMSEWIFAAAKLVISHLTQLLQIYSLIIVNLVVKRRNIAWQLLEFSSMNLGRDGKRARGERVCKYLKNTKMPHSTTDGICGFIPLLKNLFSPKKNLSFWWVVESFFGQRQHLAVFWVLFRTLWMGSGSCDRKESPMVIRIGHRIWTNQVSSHFVTRIVTLNVTQRAEGVSHGFTFATREHHWPSRSLTR